MGKKFYFVPRNTWFYTTCSGYSAITRYGLTVGVLGCIFFLWLSTSYRLFAQRSALQAQVLERIIGEKGKLIEIESGRRELLTQIEQKKSDLYRAVSGVKHDRYITWLFDMMHRHNLFLQAYVPQAGQSKKWYTKHLLRLDYAGSYENIVSFMDELAASTLPLVCSYLHMEKHQDRIAVSCQISQYDFEG